MYANEQPDSSFYCEEQKSKNKNDNSNLTGNNNNTEFFGRAVSFHPEDEEEVIKKALQKFESEKDILQRILDGESTMSIYGFDKLVEELKK